MWFSACSTVIFLAPSASVLVCHIRTLTATVIEIYELRPALVFGKRSARPDSPGSSPLITSTITSGLSLFSLASLRISTRRVSSSVVRCGAERISIVFPRKLNTPPGTFPILPQTGHGAPLFPAGVSSVNFSTTIPDRKTAPQVPQNAGTCTFRFSCCLTVNQRIHPVSISRTVNNTYIETHQWSVDAR